MFPWARFFLDVLVTAGTPTAVKIALNNIFSGESRLRRILRRNKTILSFY